MNDIWVCFTCNERFHLIGHYSALEAGPSVCKPSAEELDTQTTVPLLHYQCATCAKYAQREGIASLTLEQQKESEFTI